MEGILRNKDRPHLRYWRVLVRGLATFLILLPAIAMQFTTEVDWNGLDFAIMGVILFSACCAFELAARAAGHSNVYLLATCISIATAFLLVWINLAVGMIKSEDYAANLLFGLVLIVGMFGAVLVRLQARGMARVLIAMAVVQASIGVYAALGNHIEATILTVFFAGSWLLAAHLFGVAAREQHER